MTGRILLFVRIEPRFVSAALARLGRQRRCCKDGAWVGLGEVLG